MSKLYPSLAQLEILRVCLFWLKRVSGNHFTLLYVFGKHRKIGSTEINFSFDCKIPLSSRKSISVSILPSNDFQPSQTKREREGESKKREHTPPASQARAAPTAAPITHITRRPSFFFFLSSSSTLLLPIWAIWPSPLNVTDLAITDH